MAVVPAGAVAGIEGELRVLEDLTSADAPIIFEGTTRRFEITKSGERIVPTNASGLWGGRGDKAVLAAGADLLGNAILSRTPDDPTYAEVAPLLPPVLATSLHCGDFALGTQSFVGSRVATEKRSFSAMGVDAWANTRQQYHFDVEQLSLNNTRAVRKPPARASTPTPSRAAVWQGLLGGFLPALRWHWPLPSGDYVEQLAFAVPESTDDAPFDVASQQPVWFRYLVSCHYSPELPHRSLLQGFANLLSLCYHQACGHF